MTLLNNFKHVWQPEMLGFDSHRIKNHPMWSVFRFSLFSRIEVEFIVVTVWAGNWKVDGFIPQEWSYHHCALEKDPGCVKEIFPVNTSLHFSVLHAIEW